MSRISGDKLLVESRLLGRDATVQAHSAHLNKDDDVVRYYAAMLDPVTPPSVFIPCLYWLCSAVSINGWTAVCSMRGGDMTLPCHMRTHTSTSFPLRASTRTKTTEVDITAVVAANIRFRAPRDSGSAKCWTMPVDTRRSVYADRCSIFAADTRQFTYQ